MFEKAQYMPKLKKNSGEIKNLLYNICGPSMPTPVWEFKA